MKQLIVLIHRLVTVASLAIEHRFIGPGRNPSEPIYAVVRVKENQHFRK
jgi:hypothetical protein